MALASVFLGGICNGSEWRKDLIPMLHGKFFNPVIEGRDWTEEDRLNEVKQREECDYCLYVITPRMNGLYSLAEIIDDSNKRPTKTLIYLKEKDRGEGDKTVSFIPEVSESIENIFKLAVSNGAKRFYSLQSVADFLNSLD
jgi:hypothetical protein